MLYLEDFQPYMADRRVYPYDGQEINSTFE